MIEAKDLTMLYGQTLALDQVSFQVKEKEVVGLLGPNGAGKTTLMRILTTFLYPTRGTALINGVDITEDPLSVRKMIGYLPETPPLYMDMRVDDFIDFVGRARGLTIYNDARRQNRPFDAVLLDLTMPAGMMGGEEAVKELKKIDPQVKAVATSGDPTYPAMENYQQFGFCARIVKPYDIEELKNLLEQVTNRKEGV